MFRLTEQHLINIKNDNSISPKAIREILLNDIKSEGYFMEKKSFPDNFKTVTIDDCDFSSRTYNALCRHICIKLNIGKNKPSDIYLSDIFDMVKLDYDWNKSIRFIGKKCADEVYKLFLEKGLLTELEYTYLEKLL